MSDSYLNFANSAFGAKLTNVMGLPKPLLLARYRTDQPVLSGSLLLGGAPGAQLLPSLAKALQSMAVQSVAHRALPQWVAIANQQGLLTGRWGVEDQPGAKVKALLFDATGMTDSSQSEAIYQFFHDAARSVLACGRVVVIGRPPESCASPRQATVQRALEGLTRSLGKELKRAITSNLVYCAEGAEDQLESTLRFLLSPRSTYVTGQVIRVGKPTADAASSNWAQPLDGLDVADAGNDAAAGHAAVLVIVQFVAGQ